MAVLRGNRARFHGVLYDGCHTAVREHLMRELDLAVLRHVEQTRRTVVGGVRMTHCPIPERNGTLVTAAPARTAPAGDAEPGLPAYLRGATPWLLCIHRAHGRFADDGLAVFDATCAFDAAVAPAVFAEIAGTLSHTGISIGDRLSWHGITIRPAEADLVGADPGLFLWARHGVKARSGMAYVCPGDINFGLYLMYDGHRQDGMSAAAAAADARAWFRSGQLGSPVFPWPIGDGRPFDVPRPKAPASRRRPRKPVSPRSDGMLSPKLSGSRSTTRTAARSAESAR